MVTSIYETTLCHIPEDSSACEPPVLLSFWHYATTSQCQNVSKHF